MPATYATYEDYVLDTEDETTARSRVERKLEELSADLRAECGIRGEGALTGDAATVARRLVIDAVYGALVTPELPGFVGSMEGVRQASFTADGMSQSFTVASGRAYFDRSRLARLKRLLGCAQRAGMVYPYGW